MAICPEPSIVEVELEHRLSEAKEELFNLRFQNATGQLDNSARLGQVRKDIARVETLLREREIAAAEALGTEQVSFSWRQMSPTERPCQAISSGASRQPGRPSTHYGQVIEVGLRARPQPHLLCHVRRHAFQKFCPIQKTRLGSMGKPARIEIEGQPVFLCCSGCADEARKDPKTTLDQVARFKKEK